MADHNISALIDTAEALAAKMDAMRQAQRAFAAFSQEQVDHIFFEAAKAANRQRIPLAKMAVAETGMGVVEDKASSPPSSPPPTPPPLPSSRPSSP